MSVVSIAGGGGGVVSGLGTAREGELSFSAATADTTQAPDNFSASQ